MNVLHPHDDDGEEPRTSLDCIDVCGARRDVKARLGEPDSDAPASRLPDIVVERLQLDVEGAGDKVEEAFM